jgi:hypothetical protein
MHEIPDGLSTPEMNPSDNSDSAPTRMQHFERGCAILLARLYEQFPLACHIRLKDLEPDVTGELELIHSATVEFLSREGYLLYSGGRGPRARGLVYNNEFTKVALTAKGLAVLDAVPSVLKRPDDGEREKQQAAREADQQTPAEPDQRSRGKRLIDALKSGGTEAARAIIRETISQSVKHTLGG